MDYSLISILSSCDYHVMVFVFRSSIYFPKRRFHQSSFLGQWCLLLESLFFVFRNMIVMKQTG